MAGKKREAPPVEKEQPTEGYGQTAEQTYAELAASVPTVEDTVEEAPVVDPRVAQLEQELAEMRAKLELATPTRVLDPADRALDKPVIDTAPKSKIEKGEVNDVASFRELKVHPDDLDPGLKVNPDTGQIVKCKFISRRTGNLVEMP